MIGPVLKRERDFGEFLKALWRRGRPAYLPFYEHLASPGFIARRTGVPFDRMTRGEEGYWETYVDFWLGMGYDCIPMEIPPALPLPAGHGGLSEGSEAFVVIRSMEDLERYPWPPESDPIELRHFETVARLLPEGVKIVGGVEAGPFEWASRMLGVMGMSYALADEPELVDQVFERIGKIHESAARQLASMEVVGALRQGDDLGFKTSTFLSPNVLRRLVLPIYTRLVSHAHAAGKPFILHSCGNLAGIHEDLIEGCGIDAKHSFEDVILPVEDFKARYGGRVTALGGLDVDVICRAGERELRAYVRRKIEACWADGWWALGTGNSLTDYMPVERYMMVLEEGMRAGA